MTVNPSQLQQQQMRYILMKANVSRYALDNGQLLPPWRVDSGSGQDRDAFWFYAESELQASVSGLRRVGLPRGVKSLLGLVLRTTQARSGRRRWRNCGKSGGPCPWKLVSRSSPYMPCCRKCNQRTRP